MTSKQADTAAAGETHPESKVSIRGSDTAAAVANGRRADRKRQRRGSSDGDEAAKRKRRKRAKREHEDKSSSRDARRRGKHEQETSRGAKEEKRRNKGRRRDRSESKGVAGVQHGNEEADGAREAKNSSSLPGGDHPGEMQTAPSAAKAAKREARRRAKQRDRDRRPLNDEARAVQGASPTEQSAPRRHRKRGGATHKALQHKPDSLRKKKRQARGRDAPAPQIEDQSDGDREVYDDSEAAGLDSVPTRGLRSPLATSIRGTGEEISRRMFAALESEFETVGVKLVPATGQGDFTVFFATETQIDRRDETIKVILGSSRHDGPDDRSVARTAKEHSAIFLPLRALVRRYGTARMIADDRLSDNGIRIVAAKIRDSVLLAESGIAALGNSHIGAPPDLAQALGLSKEPVALLKSLNWSGKSPARSLRASFRRETIEDFLDGKIRLKVDREWRSLPVTFPLDWSTKFPSEAAESAVYGLNFISEVLTYWLQRANQATSERITEVDAALKQRSVTASMLLARASDVLIDAVRNSHLLPKRAWRLPAMQARARSFELFLLCCRAAGLRRIKFDEAACGPLFRGLLDVLERLRPAGKAGLGSSIAFRQEAFLAAMALPLRKTPYGAFLLEEALGSLCAYQLELGISDDGVWREGFAQHSSVLAALGTLADDLRAADVSPRPVAHAMVQLAKFADAFLREDGSCPSIAELAPKRYQSARRAAERILQKSTPQRVKKNAEAPQLRDAVLFRNAGFFISRSPNIEGKASSHFVLHARPPSEGGMSLALAVGATQLLVGGGTANRKAPKAVLRASRFDPAAHNSIRVNGQTYDNPGAATESSAWIDQAWEEKHWAAAKVVNKIFDGASVVRTTIHLKPRHALLIVDELLASEDAAKFEQFWHISPDLRAPKAMGAPLCFSSESGALAASFDNEHAIEVVEGGPGDIGWTDNANGKLVANPYIVRTKMGGGLMASLFRWGPEPMRHQIHVKPGVGGWRVAVAGEGLVVQFASEADQLKLIG